MTFASNPDSRSARPTAKTSRIPLYFGLAILLTPAALLAADPTAAPASAAQSAPHHFNIGKQPLYSALNALAEQGGVQLVFTEEMVKGLSSTGVSGEMSLEQALTQALARHRFEIPDQR